MFEKFQRACENLRKAEIGRMKSLIDFRIGAGGSKGSLTNEGMDILSSL